MQRNYLKKPRLLFVLFSLPPFLFLIAYLFHFLGPDSSLIKSQLVVTDATISTNLGLFLFINGCIAVLLLFVSLVLKNLLTLVIDLKYARPGSRLRSRLVGAFVALSFVPMISVFFMAQIIVSTLQQTWFSRQVSQTVSSSLAIARAYYEDLDSELFKAASKLSEQLSAGDSLNDIFPPFSPRSGEDKSTLMPLWYRLKETLAMTAGDYALEEVILADSKGREIVSYRKKDDLSPLPLPRLSLAALHKAQQGEIVTQPETSLTNLEYLRAYAPIPGLTLLQVMHPNDPPQKNETNSDESTWPISLPRDEAALTNTKPPIIILTKAIPQRINNDLKNILDSHADYRELLTYKRPVDSSRLLTLAVVTAVLTFAAIWVGFYLARGLSGPIQLLAQGTQEIAQGNLEHRIPEVGDDELGILVQSFNRMTSDLRQTTEELVSRRLYMETLLNNIGIGVISVDADNRVETLNHAAQSMIAAGGSSPSLETSLQLPANHSLHLNQCVPPDLYVLIMELQIRLQQGEGDTVSCDRSILLQTEAKHLHLSVSSLKNNLGNPVGYVILIDDSTELVKAQRIAAWREVAQRIAHEIRNPLTPIQLSAQRIQKRLSKTPDSDQLASDAERVVVLDGTSIILGQVDVLRQLVNEFSHFARMPRASLQLADLNQIVTETVDMYRALHSKYSIIAELDSSIPSLSLDPVQIGQMLVNLLDNAINALEQCETGSEIKVQTKLSKDKSLARLRVYDNGPGVPDTDKSRLFEPYFSTRKEGTGLGLAIVSTIAQDHGGQVRVGDNKPRGAVFTVELPVRGSGLNIA